ncbi:MAG: hypothetical protein CMK99_00455 [Pseudomonas sp.]|nr:hypothetical protein [Pseudomonas sp.]|tara:strand:- start:2579 stop:3175 length:597 start_codon:yes stop_codon:yes gene_type:complete
MEWVKILNSEGLSTLVLLITGISAFATYFLQKRNEARDAATILLNEIRNAERTIATIHHTKNINDITIILTSNSWNKYSHLFARRLDQDEFNQVTEFYKKCELAEGARKFFLQVRNDAISAKARYVQYSLIQLMTDAVISGNSPDYPEKRQALINMTNIEDHLFSPGEPLSILIGHITNIPQITTSSAGMKIKKLSES